MHQALDVMDAVATHRPARTERRRVRVSHAFVYGAVGLCALLLVGILQLRPPSQRTPAELVAAHRYLVSELDAQMQWWYTVEARPQLRNAEWIPQDSAETRLAGSETPYTIYRKRAVLITSFQVPAGELDLNQFRKVRNPSGNYHLAAYDGHTSMVAWPEYGYWRVLTADVSPELLANFVALRYVERRKWHDEVGPVFPELP
jgi:hypothetical protein